MKTKIGCAFAGLLLTGTAAGSPVELIQNYKDTGAGPFSATAGRTAWTREHRPGADGNPRSCASCHDSDPSRAGRHAKTGKPIEPMAVSVNPGRLQDPKKVEKWFRRNCRWTLGRECTPQEKGDFIEFITSR